ncbi:MAG TPA: hypothetical protein VHA13_01680, partial [Gammaproteobacteria bacterium]|nr:hypothetical protein [Gammaproteobacteria bacterium]
MSFIQAIAIYTYRSGADFLKVISAPDASKMKLFNDNLLGNVENNSLPQLVKEEPNHIFHYRYTNEHHYVKKLAQPDIVMAILSKTKISPEELTYLFINIAHTYNNKDVVKISVHDILENPLAYTGKDILLKSVSSKTEEVKSLVHKNIEKIIERGEKLDVL